MRGLARGQRGMSLMEILIVMSLMAILAAVAVPNVAGVMSRGREKSYGSDREVLQTSVEVWRSTLGRSVGPSWPILQGGEACLGKVDPVSGLPNQTGCNPYIDIGLLASKDLLASAEAIRSADTAKNTTALSVGGSYGWYVDANRQVKSHPGFIEGQYP